MREPAFLKKNKNKWLEYERQLFGDESSRINPDRLAELYIQLTDDLAYARTFYPRSKIVKYLNGLAAQTHLTIYKNKKEKKQRFSRFWTTELPMAYRRAHRFMFYSFAIFTISFLIGLLSVFNQQDFARVILGDGYVNMTIDNIRNNDPMGVYKDEDKGTMFASIAYNNVRVSFLAFAAGISFSLLTVWILFQNGVMVGAFLGFFHVYGDRKSVFWEIVPVVYIHGTLELSAIVIAGGAGMMMGNSILFPKTYSRIRSLRVGATNGVKMIVGLIPVFLLAAFFEGYITRLTEMPLVLKMTIILSSLAFVLWYYIIYPILVERKLANTLTHGTPPYKA